jgi:outer membrane protein
MRNIQICSVMALYGLLAAQPAFAEAGDILLKGRAIYVMPKNSLVDIPVGLGNGPVSVKDAIGAEFSATYLWSDQVGIEFALGGGKTSFPTADSAAARGELLSASGVMPSVIVQFHPMPKAAVRPYIGIGVNYTLFYDEKPGAILLNNTLNSKSDLAVQVEGKFGVVGQFGIDIPIDGKTFFNIDVKYVKSSTTLSIKNSKFNFVDVSIDPFIFGVGLGFRF